MRCAIREGSGRCRSVACPTVSSSPPRRVRWTSSARRSSATWSRGRWFASTTAGCTAGGSRMRHEGPCASSSTSISPAPTRGSAAAPCTRRVARWGVGSPSNLRSEADMVIAVPTTSHSAAQGFSEVSGLPYGDGLYKNNYVGRTFIQPSQSLRDLGVKLKLNPLPDSIRGKRLVVVDDSIMRGHDDETGRADAPRGRSDRGPHPDHVPADPMAVLLRDRHADAAGADRRRPHRGADPQPMSAPTRSATSRSTRWSRPQPATATPIPSAARASTASTRSPCPRARASSCWKISCSCRRYVSGAYRAAGVDTEAAAKAVAPDRTSLPRPHGVPRSPTPSGASRDCSISAGASCWPPLPTGSGRSWRSLA